MYLYYIKVVVGICSTLSHLIVCKLSLAVVFFGRIQMLNVYQQQNSRYVEAFVMENPTNVFGVCIYIHAFGSMLRRFSVFEIITMLYLNGIIC